MACEFNQIWSKELKHFSVGFVVEGVVELRPNLYQNQYFPYRDLTNSLTLVLLRGVATTPLTVFALVLKIAQPRGKIAPGTFKFILSLHFSKKIPNLPPTPGVG